MLKIARSGNVKLLHQIAKKNENLLLGSTPRKDTALHIAVRSGNFKFAVEISKHCPALLLQQNARGDTALHIAARNGCPVLVRGIIDIARLIRKNEGVVEEMVTKRNAEENTALHEAATKCHDRVVLELLRAGPQISFLVNRAGASPLYLAAENGPLKSVEHLIFCVTNGRSHGGPHNRTPIHAAVIGGQLGKRFDVKFPQLVLIAFNYS